MRAALALGVIVLASCGSPGGVELVITPTPDVDRIALYVGIGSENHQNITPDGVTQPISTSTWIRDAHNELSQVKSVGGRTVSFGLLGPSDPISMLIVVGYNAAGKPVAAAVLPPADRPLNVPNSYLARYEIALVPTVGVDPQSSLDIRVWKPTDPSAPGEQAECVLAQQLRNGSERDAIVSDKDPDCDGWPDDMRVKECLGTVFMGTKLPRLDSSINCLLPTPITDTSSGVTVQAAVLGGDHCVDGQGTVSGCFPSNYCLPKSVYDACGMGGLACAQDVTGPDAVLLTSHMECSIANDGNGHLCTDPIPGLPDPLAVVDTHGCKQDSVRISRPSQPWGPMVNVTTTSGAATFTLTVASPTTDCKFTITPSAGTIPTAPFNTFSTGALIAADLNNGRGIAMPYVFHIEGSDIGCGNPNPCVLQPANVSIPDGTFQCMKSPPL